MSTATQPARVAIVGGGASGVLTAIHLAIAAGDDDRALAITLSEPRRLGWGIAYSTRDADHRLNVPAIGMSAHPDDPEHFLRWFHANRSSDLPATGFAPRRDYGAYLVDVLSETLDANPQVTFDHVRAKVAGLIPIANGWQVDLEGGISSTVDAVVLALGAGPPATTWAPPELLASRHFIADPWARPVNEDDIPGRGGVVLLVGAGLTMADQAITWARAGATVHVTSRHGMLPLAHADRPAPKPALPALPEELNLQSATQLVLGQVKAATDWRAGIDSLRPVTQELWQQLPLDDQIRFIRGGALRRWGRARHRVAPEIGARLDELIAEGRLVSHEGTVASATEGVGKVEVRLTTGQKLIADVVVNCTGPANDPAHSGEPLVRELISANFARPHPVGMGIDVEPDGRLRSELALPPIWATGPMLQGELWESTAIPEIRVHAAALTAQIFAAIEA